MRRKVRSKGTLWSSRRSWCRRGGVSAAARASTQRVTDAISQAAVQGLTKLLPQSEAVAPELREDVAGVHELEEVIRRDVEDREYLWTGKLSLDVFDRNATFADPTLSFTGKDKFAKNAQSLDRVSKQLIRSHAVSLRHTEIDERRKVIIAHWQMVGDFKLPWAPRIDVSGATEFAYSGSPPSERTSEDDAPLRIVSYRERWITDPFEALLQLAKPGPPGSIQDALAQSDFEKGKEDGEENINQQERKEQSV